MKTTIELNGFEISIEELEGKITVSASKEGEVVEEFELSSEEGDNEEGMEDEGGEELVPFGEEGEEDDLGGQEEMEGDDDNEFSDDDESDDDDDDESKLESFTSFIKKRKK